jgi:hypothetical protein
MAQSYLTVEDLATHFRVKERTIRGWITDGILPKTYIKWKRKSYALKPGAIAYLEKHFKDSI